MLVLLYCSSTRLLLATSKIARFEDDVPLEKEEKKENVGERESVRVGDFVKEEEEREAFARMEKCGVCSSCDPELRPQKRSREGRCEGEGEGKKKEPFSSLGYGSRSTHLSSSSNVVVPRSIQFWHTRKVEQPRSWSFREETKDPMDQPEKNQSFVQLLLFPIAAMLVMS